MKGVADNPLSILNLNGSLLAVNVCQGRTQANVAGASVMEKYFFNNIGSLCQTYKTIFFVTNARSLLSQV